MSIFYVDTNADPLGDGTTSATTGAHCAWDTVADVNGATFAAGDTVLFNKGCTWREQLTVPNSGSSGLPITFGSYGSGVNPIVSGFDVVTGWTNYETGAGDGTGNLLDDNFNDNDITDWTLSGTPTAGSGVVTFNASEYMQKAFTASGEIWVQFSFYAAVLPGGSYNMVIIQDGNNNHCNMFMESDGDIKIWNAIGSANLDITYRYTAGDTIKVEIHWKKSATVGEVHCWINDILEYSNTSQNNGTTDADTVRLGPNGVWTWILDNVKVDNAGYIGGGATATNYWYKAHAESGGGIVMENGSPMGYVLWNTDAPTSFLGKTAPVATFDNAGDRVYVWCTANADPATKTMQVSKREHAIAIDGKDYITIENLTFEGAFRHGGHQTGGADYVTWTNDIFRYNGGTNDGGDPQGNGFEVNGGSTNLTMTGCSFYQNFDIGISIQMLTGNGNLSAVVIDGATCYENRASGIEILMGSGNGTMSNITVKNSTLRNNDGTGWSGTHVNESGIYVDSYIAANMSNVSLQYNLIYANGIRGIYTLKNSTGAVPVTAYNNVIYNNGIGVVNTATLTIENNITSENTNGEINTNTDITSDYNEIYHSAGGSFITYDSATHTFAQWQAHGFDAHGLSSDPLFVSTATPDFHLQATSPCINKGTNVSLTKDYEGNNVPNGEIPDMGAYEYTPTGGTSIPYMANIPVIPTRGATIIK